MLLFQHKKVLKLTQRRSIQYTLFWGVQGKTTRFIVIKRLNFIIYKSIFYLAYVHSLPQTYNYLHLYKPSPHFSNVLMLCYPFRITKHFITSNNTTSTHAAVFFPLFIIPSSLSPSHPLDIGVGVIPNERRTKVEGVEV